MPVEEEVGFSAFKEQKKRQNRLMHVDMCVSTDGHHARSIQMFFAPTVKPSSKNESRKLGAISTFIWILLLGL